MSVVCCEVEVSATGRSLVQRSPNECGVSVCVVETSKMRRPEPTGAVEPGEKKKLGRLYIIIFPLGVMLMQGHVVPSARIDLAIKLLFYFIRTFIRLVIVYVERHSMHLCSFCVQSIFLE